MAEEPFSSLALSYSHCSASTSCLVDPPILPAWPISVLLKYMIDRIQIILLHQVPVTHMGRKNLISNKEKKSNFIHHLENKILH